MNKLQIKYMNIDKLIPYINNPRTNDNAVDKVAASIKEFGFKNPDNDIDYRTQLGIQLKEMR